MLSEMNLQFTERISFQFCFSLKYISRAVLEKEILSFVPAVKTADGLH